MKNSQISQKFASKLTTGEIFSLTRTFESFLVQEMIKQKQKEWGFILNKVLSKVFFVAGVGLLIFMFIALFCGSVEIIFGFKFEQQFEKFILRCVGIFALLFAVSFYGYRFYRVFKDSPKKHTSNILKKFYENSDANIFGQFLGILKNNIRFGGENIDDSVNFKYLKEMQFLKPFSFFQDKTDFLSFSENGLNNNVVYISTSIMARRSYVVESCYLVSVKLSKKILSDSIRVMQPVKRKISESIIKNNFSQFFDFFSENKENTEKFLDDNLCQLLVQFQEKMEKKCEFLFLGDQMFIKIHTKEILFDLTINNPQNIDTYANAYIFLRDLQNFVTEIQRYFQKVV